VIEEFGLTVKIYCRMVSKLSGGDWFGLEMVQRLVCALSEANVQNITLPASHVENLRVRLVPMLGPPGIVGPSLVWMSVSPITGHAT
jgi:hypothetical protein